VAKSNSKGRGYPPEFREQIVGLHRAGRSAQSLAKEFDLSYQTVLNWLKQADLDAGKPTDGLTTVELDELTRLRRENKQLKIEREILSKAAAWFAREAQPVRSVGRHRSHCFH
jgi:transposase